MKALWSDWLRIKTVQSQWLLSISLVICPSSPFKSSLLFSMVLSTSSNTQSLSPVTTFDVIIYWSTGLSPWDLDSPSGFNSMWPLHSHLSAAYFHEFLCVCEATNCNFQMCLISWEVLHTSKSYFLLHENLHLKSHICGKKKHDQQVSVINREFREMYISPWWQKLTGTCQNTLTIQVCFITVPTIVAGVISTVSETY